MPLYGGCQILNAMLIANELMDSRVNWGFQGLSISWTLTRLMTMSIRGF